MLIPKTSSRSSTRKTALGRPEAETLALTALAWIAEDDDRLGRFLALTGLDGDTLRARAADPAVLAGVLDCLLGDESWVIAFAEDSGIDPALPVRARLLLPGSDGPPA